MFFPVAKDTEKVLELKVVILEEQLKALKKGISLMSTFSDEISNYIKLTDSTLKELEIFSIHANLAEYEHAFQNFKTYTGKFYNVVSKALERKDKSLNDEISSLREQLFDYAKDYNPDETSS